METAKIFTPLFAETQRIQCFEIGIRFAKYTVERFAFGKFTQRIFNLEAKKMITKIYALVWVFGALAAGVLFLTGNFNPYVNILFGFLSFGAIFMGMIAVLPLTVTHHAAKKH